MLEFQKVFLETLEDGISASSDFNILETPSQFRVSILDFGLKQKWVGIVQNSPLKKKLLSLAHWQGKFSAFIALFFRCGKSGHIFISSGSGNQKSGWHNLRRVCPVTDHVHPAFGSDLLKDM